MYDQRQYFGQIIGFTQGDLQPCKLNRFIMNLSSEWFLHHKQPLTVLRDHVAVGLHTDICTIKLDGQITRFFWSHPAIKPFGNPLPLQCQKCWSVNPWIHDDSKIENGELSHVSIHCKVCKDIWAFPRTSEGTIKRVGLRGQHDATERGEWFYKLLNISSLST